MSCELRPGARGARSVHRHRRPRGRRRRARVPAAASSASISPARCCGSASAKCAALGARSPDPLVRGDATRIPVARRVVRRGDDRVRHPQRGRAGRGARRAGARARAGRPSRDPRVRSAAHARHPRRCTRGISATCCRRRAAGLEAPERLFVPAGVGRHVSRLRPSSPPQIAVKVGFLPRRARRRPSEPSASSISTLRRPAAA